MGNQEPESRKLLEDKKTGLVFIHGCEGVWLSIRIAVIHFDEDSTRFWNRATPDESVCVCEFVTESCGMKEVRRL